MKNILAISFLFIGLCSCKEEKKINEGPSKMEQVMNIHDEIMPEMGKLAKYTAELKAKIDTTEMGLQYESAMKDLQQANTSMMDWMMSFGDRFNSDEILNGKELTAQKQEWLIEEEEKVKALREEVYSSLKRAEKLLNAQ